MPRETEFFRLPGFFVPLLVDAKSRVDTGNYNLKCLQFTLGRHPDGYFVLVNHTNEWLRANGYQEEGQSYRGGHSYCGPDVSFEYDRSGNFVEKVYQR